MSTKLKSVLVIAYALYVAWLLLLASVPPVSRDALTHHLAVPRLWVENGGIYEIPHILFSYYPQLLDLLYTLPLLAGNDIAAKYIHMLFGLATALMIFLFVRRRIGPAWGGLAGLLFLTVPLIARLSVTVYVDLGLICFTTGALFSAVMWLEDERNAKWLIIAGIFSGLALSTKYTAIASFVVLSLLVPLFYLRTRASKESEQWNTVKYGVLFVSISLLVFSPWLIRNYALTGNPIYPLQQGLFASTSVDSGQSEISMTAEDHAALAVRERLANKPKPLGPLLTRRFVHEESLPYTLLIPARVFFEGQDDNPKYFDGRLNVFLLLLPLALLYFGRETRFRPTETAMFAWYAVLVVALVFLTKDMRVRWIATIIAPLVVLSTYCLYAIRTWLLDKGRSPGTANAVTAALVMLYLLPNATYAVGLYQKIDPLPYVSGRQSVEEYRLSRLPEYGVVSAANRIVPEGNKLLVLFLGRRSYYFTADAFAVNAIFTRIAENSESADDMVVRLRQLGYSHILMRNDLLLQSLATLDEAVRSRAEDFLRYRLREEAAGNGYGLYAILSP